MSRGARQPSKDGSCLAVYTDFSYRSAGEKVTAELPFSLFIGQLSQSFDQVIALGRLAPGTAPFPFALQEGIGFVGLPFYKSLANPRHVLRVSFTTVRRFVRSTAKADAIWLFGPHPFCPLFAVIALARGQRVVLGVRQDLPALIANRRPDDRLIKLAAGVLERSYRWLARILPTVVVGPDLARHYSHARRLLDLQISLVHAHDVLPESEALSRSYDGPLRAVSVGRLAPEKNPLLLADIAAQLKANDSRWRLVVYGDGPSRPILEQRITDLGVEDFIELRGYLPFDGGLLDAYRDSHALLHVSWTEGVPQVLFEAFAAGLPVVATDVGGVAGATGASALLIPPGEVAPAVEALERIAAQATTREPLVRDGLARVAATTLETQAQRAADFIRQT